MKDYLRAVCEQVKWDVRAVVLFVLAAVVFSGSVVTLIRGDAAWVSLILLLASGLFIALCVYLIRIDVRRARAKRGQSPGGGPTV